MPGAGFPDAEEFLDGLTVQPTVSMPRRMLRISEVPETTQVGQAQRIPLITQRKGATRNYMILWRLGRGLNMNDKGHYHSYRMGAQRSGDLPASRNSAAAISVERIGEGRGSWRSLRGMAVATRNVRDFGHMGVDVIDDPRAGA